VCAIAIVGLLFLEAHAAECESKHQWLRAKSYLGPFPLPFCVGENDLLWKLLDDVEARAEE
jgi:hypothetical protein